MSSAASSPEFGTSDTEKSERTAFLQDNADKSQAFPQSAAWRRLWRRYIAWATRPGGWLGPIQYEDDEFSDWARR